MAYKPKSKGTKRPRRYAGRKARPSGKKNSFVARVKRVIHSQMEDKFNSLASANTAINFAGSVTNPTFINLLPQPSQGTGAHNRIGNQIRVTKSTIRGMVNLLPYNATSNPCDVPIYLKMWICRRKSNNIGDGDVPTSSDWAQFFQVGTVTAPFQSTILDMLLDTNTEYWTVYRQKMVQLSNYSAQNNLATTTLATTLTPMSGKVSIPFSFDITKYLGLLKYNDTTSNPCNKELFLVFQGVRADGTTGAGSFAETHFVIDHKYEDA